MTDSDPNSVDANEEPTIPPRSDNACDPDSEQPTLAPVSQPTPNTSMHTRSGGAKPQLQVPLFEDYEILDELGRGGMGVVYKARDTKLDRTVALKMIIGGKFASTDDIQRFRIEGEAAARLDHPGIVPIYEIGEADGNHFFSMKFIEGDALSEKLQDFQNDHRLAAELLIGIARAVQHAHQRGVLHRDLKPANVLIDRDGQPSVTDLGLAKRIDGDSELTQTGLVMGTPGFMAPEQAAGRKDITTAADVFSLGAILYWLVAGEAPFKGETAVQTVLNTIEGSAPSLRLSSPSVSLDLDLICQKAMHNEPLNRYSSAAALADDLQAWQDGELLSVRAPTALSVASVWVRKNLRMVLGACLAGLICGLTVGGIAMMGELAEAAEVENRIQQLAPDSRTWVSRFIGLRNLPPGWRAIQYLIVPCLAISAFICVLLVRPKSREANIISAVTSGLVAGIIAFLIGLGWGALNENSIDSGAKDIKLLSTAIWLESDTERKLAQRALLQRYPGLVEMDTGQRQQRIQEKIRHDQTTGMLPGMWMGVCISILFTTFPMMFTCILSGLLWREGMRGWQWFGCTWERCAYCLLFFLVLSFWLRPIPPATWIMLASLAALAFALYLAVRQVSWIWRVLIIPVPFICMSVIGADVDSMRMAGYRAGKASDKQELRLQMERCDRLLAHAQFDFQQYRTAIGWLHLGEEEKYQSHCQTLLNNFEGAYQPEVASRLAKVCLLRPDLQNSDDLQTLFELSEFASAFESNKLIHWFYATRALAELRQGNPAKTLDWNLRSRVDGQDSYRYLHAFSFAVDGLAHVELNDFENARSSFEHGRTIANEAHAENIKDGNDEKWVNWLAYQIISQQLVGQLSTDEGSKN